MPHSCHVRSKAARMSKILEGPCLLKEQCDNYTVYRNITHTKEFSRNQGKRQNFDPSILPYKFKLIFMGMKQKKIFFFRKKNSKWPTQKKLIFQNGQFLKFFRENL